MTLVDTSVWADYLNDHSSSEAERLDAMIESGRAIATCGLVWAELLQGLRSESSVRSVSAYLASMQYLRPLEPGTYQRSAALYRKLRRRGVTVRSTIDCLVAQTAIDNDVGLLAKDRDFRLMAESGLTALRLD